MNRKTKHSKQQSVANKLVKQSEQNDKLRQKTVGNSFWKLFIK